MGEGVAVVFLDEVANLGRVGVITARPALGQHILVVRDTKRGWWQLYCEPPWENFEAVGISVDFDNYIDGDDVMSEILDTLKVKWVPIEDDDRIEMDLFGVRSSFISIFWPIYLFDDADYAYRCEAAIDLDSYLEGYVEYGYEFFDSSGRRILCDYSPDEKLIITSKEIDADGFAASAQKFIARYSDPLRWAVTSKDPEEVSQFLVQAIAEVEQPKRRWRVFSKKKD